jgi:hypothetical protein
MSVSPCIKPQSLTMYPVASYRLCSDKERWTKPTTYAVKKSGRVRAIKVHDSIKTAEEQVEALGKDHHVETREGECVRCSGDWCRVSQWCDQYTGEIDADQRDG